jgi:hypothetical protein
VFFAFVHITQNLLAHRSSEGKLDEYIYSGEATHPTVDPKALDLIPRMNKMRRSIREIDPTDSDSAVATIENQIQGLIDLLYSRQSNIRGASSNPERIVQDLRPLKNNLMRIPSPEGREAGAFAFGHA